MCRRPAVHAVAPAQGAGARCLGRKRDKSVPKRDHSAAGSVHVLLPGYALGMQCAHSSPYKSGDTARVHRAGSIRAPGCCPMHRKEVQQTDLQL